MPQGQFSTIVAPVDFAEAEDEDGGFVADAGTHGVSFSPGTVRAVKLAASLAASHGATLYLLHAVPPMRGSAVYQGPVSVPSKIIDEIHERAQATSREAMQSLAEAHAPGVKVGYAIAPGNPLQYVLAQAASLSADLIVMAASGRSRVARLFVGSTADRIIREANCPVLVVPALRDED